MVVVVVAVLVVLLVVLVLRRREKKQLHAVNTEKRVLDNPVYAGILFSSIYLHVNSGTEKLQFVYHGHGST